MDEFRIATGQYLFFQGVNPVEGLALHGIFRPRGEIALVVGPRCEKPTVISARCAVEIDRFGWRDPLQARIFHGVRQVFTELTNLISAGAFKAESLVAHEKIDHITGSAIQP